MRILVTGASGFVGAHAVRGLLDDGHAVGAVVRAGSATDVVDDRADLCLYDGTTDGLFRRVAAFAPDVAVHLASYFVAEHKDSDIDPLIEANLRFGCQLIDALARCGATRLVNVSTAWEHYESDDYRPVSLYAATKRAFQDLCVFYADAYGLRVVTLKLSDTYGPNDRRAKLIALLLRAIHSGEHLKLSPGEQAVNFSHIDDVIDAIRAAITLTAAERFPGGMPSYAVRGAEQMTLREFVDLFADVSGKSLSVAWGERPYRTREVMRPWLGDLVPGWTPKIALSDGLRRLVPDV